MDDNMNYILVYETYDIYIKARIMKTAFKRI